MANATPKDLWLPVNCKCGRCMKIPSSIQNKCCGKEQCVTRKRKQMEKILPKENDKLPDELDWYLKCLDGEPKRMRLAKQRNFAYKAYINHKQAGNLPHEQSKCPPQQGSSSSTHTSQSQPYPADESIPRCVLRYIRKKFPDPNGQYTGFNTSNTLAVLFKTFIGDTQNDEKAFAIMEPASKTYYYSNLSGRKHKDRLKKAIIRMPRMGIVTTAVSFEGFVSDAMKLVADAVCYDLKHVFEEDYSLYKTKCTSTDEEEKYLSSLESEGSAWENLRDKLQQRLRSKNHMQTIEDSNFLQTLLEKKKKDLVYITRPTLCHIMHCLRKTMNPNHVKNEQFKRHFMCEKEEGPQKNLLEAELWNLVAHFLETSDGFEFIVPITQNAAKRTVKIVIKPENPTTLCHMSHLLYGIRCLYCHGNGDKTLEPTGALGRMWCSSNKLAQIEPKADQRISQVQEYLIQLRNRAHKKKHKLSANRFLYLNTASFYKYLAKLLAKACVCLVYHRNENHVNVGKKYMNESSENDLDLNLKKIQEAVAAMKSQTKS